MFYVYRHVRLDKNEPFYIGIGSTENFKRAFAHHSKRNIVWRRIAAKTDYDVEILFEGLTLEEACEKEIEFIALYGRLGKGGTLANLTDGGEGILGFNHRSETKEKISKNHARYWAGKKRRKSTIDKIVKKRKGKTGKLCKNSIPIIGVSPCGVEREFYGQADAARILKKETGLNFSQTGIFYAIRRSGKHYGWTFKFKNTLA